MRRKLICASKEREPLAGRALEEQQEREHNESRGDPTGDGKDEETHVLNMLCKTTGTVARVNLILLCAQSGYTTTKCSFYTHLLGWILFFECVYM